MSNGQRDSDDIWVIVAIILVGALLIIAGIVFGIYKFDYRSMSTMLILGIGYTGGSVAKDLFKRAGCALLVLVMLAAFVLLPMIIR